MHRWRCIEQRLHDPPLLFDGVLAREARAVADERGFEQHFVRRRPLAAFLAELNVELDRAGSVGAMSLDDEPDSRSRVELDHDLVRRHVAIERLEAELRRML